MNEIALQLKYTKKPLRRECARFIFSDNPVEWLDEVSKWQIPQENLRLFPLPRSIRDNRCAGVLVAFEQEFAPLRSGRTQAYGKIAKQLYLPVEAELTIEPTQQEWNSLFAGEAVVYVWHPQLGLVAFDRSEILTIAELLTSSHFRDNENSLEQQLKVWGAANPGTVYPNRIKVLRAELPASFESMLEMGRDGIGEQAKPPPPAGLPGVVKLISSVAVVTAWSPFALAGGILTRLARMAVSSRDSSHAIDAASAGAVPGLFGGIFSWFASLFPQAKSRPRTPPSPPSVPSNAGVPKSGILSAAARRWQQMWEWTAGLLDARKKEMDRLLKLLDENPDEGLKYALPLGGEPGRGVAPPSASLLRRMVDFTLRGQGSGGPADVWDLSPQTQVELSRRYRELAAREIKLGRYRRAAYIFAELLRDLNSAAQALVTGRFYREAAILYRDKLKLPLAAATCLEKGGLLHDAIPLFRQAGKLENVGDLYLRLQEAELAEGAFREAVSQCLAREDFIDAARIFEHKIKSEDEVLSTLDAGWPGSKQARACLQAVLEKCAAYGRFEEVLQRIGELRNASLTPQRNLDAVEILVATAKQCPHETSRTVAADAVRAKVSLALQQGATSRQQLMTAVSQLALEDRLLARDCQRATLATGSQRSKKVKAAETKSLPGLRRDAHQVQLFELPHSVHWETAISTDSCFYVAGWQHAQEACVARGSWNGELATVKLPIDFRNSHVSAELGLCFDSSDRSIIVSNSQGRFLDQAEFAATDHYPRKESVGTPPWLPNAVSAMAMTPAGTVYTFQMMEMVLKCFPSHRNCSKVEHLDAPLLDRTLDPSQIHPIVARDDVCYLGVEEFLFEVRAIGGTSRQSFSQKIRGLYGSPPKTEARLVVSFDRGAYLYWSEKDLSRFQWFGDDLQAPLPVLLRDGRMIVLGEAVGKKVWRVYTTADETLQQLYEVPCRIEEDVISLLLAGSPSQIGAVTSDGKVHVLEFPR